MKKHTTALKPAAGTLTLVIAGALMLTFSNRALGQDPVWDGTAKTLAQGQRVIGFFQPVRLGLANNRELSSHLLFNLAMPNLAFKHELGEKKGWLMAGRHSFRYPTMFMNVFGKSGIGGLISPELDIPQMITLRSEILLSRPVDFTVGDLVNGAGLTLKGGLAVALGGGDLDDRATLDVPVGWRQTALWQGGFQINMGADVTILIKERWSMLQDAELFVTPGFDYPTSFEHKGMFRWRKSDRFQLLFGGKLTWNEFYWGAQWHFIPLIDFQWSRLNG